jgi:hypothetical protein
MPAFGPIKRREFINILKRLGSQGPYPGGKHQYLVRGELKLCIPNPHDGEIGKDLLARILRQAEINRNDWESL